MQFLGYQSFESRIPYFTGFFAVLLLCVTLTAEAEDSKQADATFVHVSNAAFATGNDSGRAVSKSSAQIRAGGASSTGKATKNATVPGSVIALVVALIAVVAVARRDTSGTIQNP